MPTATSPTSPSTESASAEQPETLPGYFVEESSGAWLTLPRFPLGELPTIGLDVARWLEQGSEAEGHSGIKSHITGEAWRFTRGQLNLMLWWYALAPDARPERPRWLYRSGVRRGAKGTGKDPLLAAMAIAELCGPTFPAWRDGRWRGERYRLPLV